MCTAFKRYFSIFICIICIAALTACQEGGLLVDDESGGSYTLSDELTFFSTSLRSINPASSMDADFYQISKLMYDSLITLDDTLAPEASLATSWEYGSDDEKKTITFQLRTNAKFSDGTGFTADDVVFSYEAIKAAGSSPYSSKVSHLSDCEADGDDTVVFTFLEDDYASLAYFDFPIFSSRQFDSPKEMLMHTETAVLGTGVYKFDSGTIDRELKLVPNDYHAGTRAENTITISIQPITEPYVGFVKSNDFSLMVETGFDREEITGESDINVTDFTSNELEVLGFDCQGAFADVSLRQAVGSIIDRDEIISAAYFNSGTKSDDLYFPGYYGIEVKNSCVPDDEKARELLSESGYADRNGDGLVEDADGHVLKLKLVVSSSNSQRLTAADMISRSLGEYGITVDVVQVDSTAFEQTIAAGTYDMFIGGWKISEEYDLRNFYASSSGENYAGYSNVKLDKLLDKLQSGLTTEETVETLTAVKEIVDEELPYMCLLYKTYAAVSSTNLDGLVVPRFNNFYYACDDWRFRVYASDDDDDTEDSDS